jgi:hypothetical protein
MLAAALHLPTSLLSFSILLPSTCPSLSTKTHAPELKLVDILLLRFAVTFSSLSSAHSPTLAYRLRQEATHRLSKPKHCVVRIVLLRTHLKTIYCRLRPIPRPTTFPELSRAHILLPSSYKSSHVGPLQQRIHSLKMRSSTFLATMIAFVFALLAPAMAQESSWSSNSYTTTMTITLVQANATSYVHYTSNMPSAGTAMTTATATGASAYSSPSLSATPSATPSVCTNCMGSGAGTQHSNLIAVGLAGAAALFWSTL